MSLLAALRAFGTPEAFLRSVGRVFAVFDAQDSGNVSYGVQTQGRRFFVKTAGRSDDPAPLLAHPERVALLRNAARLWERCGHAHLPALRRILEGSDHGPMLVYDWADGELLGVPADRREDLASAFQRFRALPAAEIVAALDVVLDLHARLEALGYVAVDFYDGCLLYDFGARRLTVIDLDTYHEGPFVNAMGRMFGSTRFMAPEEFCLGADVDRRTTVFTLGRLIAVMLSDGTLDRAPFRGGDARHAVALRACREAPPDRYGFVAELRDAWLKATTP